MSQVRQHLPAFATWSRMVELSAVVSVALFVRILLADDIAVNGDTGLYLYDAKQLLWGRQIFVDFPSRSPVFEWVLAGAIAVGNSPIASARGLMIVISIALGVAVYYFALEIDGHHTGLVASGIFLLSPFTVVWGTWVKTEQAAGLLVVVALVYALRHVNRPDLGYKVPLVVGALFGIAWNVRRVVLVHIGAFCLWVVWYRYRQLGDLRGTARAAAVVLAGALVTILATYAAVSGFDPDLTADVGVTHGLALFLSSGQGSLGWVGLDSAEAVTAASGSGLLASVCQKCGVNTIDVFHRTLLATLPVAGAWAIVLRSYCRGGAQWWGDYGLPAIFGSLAVYALGLSIQAGDWSRALQAAALVSVVATVWLLPAVEWKRLWSPRLALPVLIIGALTAGYLYRDRILYVTYFQDFYPYVSVVAAVAVVRLWQALDDVGAVPYGLDRRRLRQVGLAAILLTAALTGAVATANAYPYQPGGPDADSSWHSVEQMQTYGDDIDARTEPGERVFAAQPLYVVESERLLAANLSRKFYAFRGWPESEKTDAAAAALVADLESGETPYAVTDSESRWPLNRADVRSAFVANYCAVDAPAYAATNGTLYEYRPNATDSECERYEHTDPER